MTYKLSAASIGDIEGIYRYTLAQFGAAQAIAYHGGLQQAFEMIVENQHIGRAHPEIDDITRSLVHQSHTIYYEIQADLVFILRVLHGQQDPMRHFS